MANLEEMIQLIGDRFGVLAESNTRMLKVIARDSDVAVGDLFLLPCRRGRDRFYIFRTTEYANVFNRELIPDDVARNKLTMPDSYFSSELAEEKLLQLSGMVLGYAQWDGATDEWSFHRPRRLPEHLSDVYLVDSGNPEIPGVIRELMQSQLGSDSLYIGDVLAGESSLEGVAVQIPTFALSQHIGIFGRTGCGKSNLMMVLLRSLMEHNRLMYQGRREGPHVSIFAIDPHNEFRTWHEDSGGADGIRGIVNSYSEEEREYLVRPFYFLTARDMGGADLEQRLVLSRADIIPDDLSSIIEFTEQQVAYSNEAFGRHGDRWIGRLLTGDVGLESDSVSEMPSEYLPGTIAAVQRRLGFLRAGATRVFSRFDPDAGYAYESLLPDIICALEHGRILILDTTLMSELEQFLATTVVARVLFSLRKALRTAESVGSLEEEIRRALGNDDLQQARGMRSLADELAMKLEKGELPYIRNGELAATSELPYVNVVVEEAPSILNPDRMRFGSVFRDISRQGRKFGIGLTVISQQVSEIDHGVLTQINTELTMGLGNEFERREAIKNASADLQGFERELQVMGKGQVILSASYRDTPLPIQVPNYDTLARESSRP